MKRRLLSVLLTCAMLFSIALPNMNIITRANDAYTIEDALEILKHLAGLTILSQYHLGHYDIDEDGSVTINDALEILKGLAGLRAAPFCECDTPDTTTTDEGWQPPATDATTGWQPPVTDATTGWQPPVTDATTDGFIIAPATTTTTTTGDTGVWTPFDTTVSDTGVWTPADTGITTTVPPVVETPAFTGETIVLNPNDILPQSTPGFRNLTAVQLVSEIRAGWNLGNAFDAHQSGNVGYAYATTDIDSLFTWVRTPPTRELIQAVNQLGFDTIRIPVTWYKVIDPNNGFAINTEWMRRVREVVQWAIDLDMYVILNTHHEYPIYEGLTGFNGRTMEQSSEMLTAIWTQIANEFNGFNERLIFEGLNEPRDRSDSTWYGNATLHAHVNTLNQAFVTAVRNTGGNNFNRILMVPAYAASGQAWNEQGPLHGFTIPADPANPTGAAGTNKLVLSVHRYEPVRFTLEAQSQSWTEAGVLGALNTIHTNATRIGLPVILGEWGTTNQDNTAQRAEYSEYYVREAHALGMKTVIWDNGRHEPAGRERLGLIDRVTLQLHSGYQSIIDAIMRGAGPTPPRIEVSPPAQTTAPPVITEPPGHDTTAPPVNTNETTTFATTPPPTQPQPGGVIYNMQNDPDIDNMRSGGSTHPFLIGAGGGNSARTVENGTIIITGRTNADGTPRPAAGIDIKIADIPSRAGHSYRIDVTGRLGSSAGEEMRLVLAESPHRRLIDPNPVTGAGGAFTMSHTVTHEEIQEYLSAWRAERPSDSTAEQRFRIRSDSSGADLVITGIVITEIAPGGITAAPPGTEPPPVTTPPVGTTPPVVTVAPPTGGTTPPVGTEPPPAVGSHQVQLMVLDTGPGPGGSWWELQRGNVITIDRNGQYTATISLVNAPAIMQLGILSAGGAFDSMAGASQAPAGWWSATNPNNDVPQLVFDSVVINSTSFTVQPRNSGEHSNMVQQYYAPHNGYVVANLWNAWSVEDNIINGVVTSLQGDTAPAPGFALAGGAPITTITVTFTVSGLGTGGGGGGTTSATSTPSGGITSATPPPTTATTAARTVTFNWNFTGAPESPVVATRSAGTLPSDTISGFTLPSRPGFNFAGWFDTSAATGGTAIRDGSSGTVFANSSTVWARWVDVSLASDFQSMTAHQAAANMGAGWNLGNTFDAFSGGSYSNPIDSSAWASWNYGANYSVMTVNRMETGWLEAYPILGSESTVTRQLIQNVKAEGFDTIRIPVTWHKAISGSHTSSTFTIRSDWMTRIKEVVDWAIAEDMYVILNTHHDEYIMPFRNTTETNTSVNTLMRLWTLIGAEFNNSYDHRLIFEVLNEPRIKGSSGEWNGGTADERTNLNRLNQAGVDAIRATGGNNRWRILMLPTYAAGSNNNSLNGFARPNDIAENNNVNKFILSVHAYEPVGYTGITGVSGSWSRSNITGMMDRVQTRASALGMPVVLGEWGAVARHDSPTGSGESGRADYARTYVEEAARRGFVPVWWDTGILGTVNVTEGRWGLFNRRTSSVHYTNITAAIREGLVLGRGY